MKCKKKTWLAVLIAVLVCLCTCLVYIHRRVIRAAIKGEPMPECPHWHPCLKKKTEEIKTTG